MTSRGGGFTRGTNLFAGLAATALSLLSIDATAGAATVNATFEATGAEQAFTVPSGVSQVTVVAVGGKGATRATAAGGFGAEVTATISVTAGQVLFVNVGGNADGASGGYNGGGQGGFSDGSPSGGGGGGGSDVRTCSASGPAVCPDGSANTLASRLLIAGGGGGAGDLFGSAIGPGAGGDAGSPGADGAESNGPGGGGGAGTAASGGSGGFYSGSVGLGEPGAAGSLAVGGDGGDRTTSGAGGGGGGGGLFGGGGGGAANFTAGGGGGGSSLVPAGGSSRIDSTGTPRVTISYQTGPPSGIALALDPATIPGDGSATSEATATVTDAAGLGVPGETVTFTSTDAGQAIGPVTDNGDGTYSATITASSTSGSATITAASGGLSDTETLTQTDATPPSISILSPGDGATYQRGQNVVADYSCADETGGSGVESCAGTVPDGAAIDTASVGEKTFTVEATDEAGNSASTEVTYTVLDCDAARKQLDDARADLKKAERKLKQASSKSERRRAKKKVERAEDERRDAKQAVRENCV